MTAPRAHVLSALAALCLACAACVAGCADLDVVTNTYSTMADARAAGAVDRGWLPALVPPGAHDIREAHDEGGSGRRWGLFNFAEGDAPSLRGRVGAESTFGGMKVDAPPRIEWWPVALRGTLDHERLASTGLRVYRLPADGLAIAVNWNQRRAYYWTVSTVAADDRGAKAPRTGGGGGAPPQTDK